ncbi:MAG: hypothetical protein BWY83_03151 [bacterium ADurb.Bin478]|nr:MAG: hypothetical protein BWY83_03151 [bacterium ADurb.Bin478]
MTGQCQPCRFTVTHPIDRVVRQFQSGANAVAEQGVVFNQQNSQLLGFLVEFGQQRQSGSQPTEPCLPIVQPVAEKEKQAEGGE